MTPNEYQALARRTRCPQPPVIGRLDTTDRITLLHSAVGMGAEAGEFLVEIQKWLWYGKTMDGAFVAHLAEELGDMMWYVCEACDALHLELEAVMGGNICKLRVRFPDKYTDALAAEEGRDRAAEARTIEEALKQTQEMESRKIREAMEKVGPITRLEPVEESIGHRFFSRPLEEQIMEGAQLQISDKPCETCGAPADVIVHDFTHDLSQTFNHWFCKAHDRLSAIVKPARPKSAPAKIVCPKCGGDQGIIDSSQSYDCPCGHSW